MGRKLINLVGLRFGKLTVESLNINNYNSGNDKIWNCKCDCGNSIVVSGDYVRLKVITPSCGCNKFVDDISGKEFGKLTVLISYHDSRNKIRYKCKCECGNEVDVCRYDLINEKRTSCGCDKDKSKPGRVKNLIGQRFGRLEVVERDNNKYFTKGGKRIYKWVCKCDCGAVVSVERGKLVSNHTTSCGCLHAEKQGISIKEYRNRYEKLLNNDGKIVDITGERFGKLVAICRDVNESKYTKWICKCDCGNTTTVTRNNLVSGHTNSCGCIDSVGEALIGKYLTENNIKHKKEYAINDCRDIHPLPFDFGLMNKDDLLIGFIEYDGEQHFRPVRFNGMTKEASEKTFEDCVRHDRMKDDYCKNNNIPILRIKYTEKEKMYEKIDYFINTVLLKYAG